MLPFYVNAINWLLKNYKNGKVVMSNHGSLNGLYDAMVNKYPCSRSNKIPDDAIVYCCTMYTGLTPRELHKFIGRGGGLLIGGQAWHWESENSTEQTLLHFPGNKILNPLGIGVLSKDTDLNDFMIPRKMKDGEFYHFRNLVHALQQSSAGDLDGLVSSVREQEYLKGLVHDAPHYMDAEDFNNWQYRNILQQMHDTLHNVEFKYPKQNISVSTTPEKLVLIAANDLYRAMPNDDSYESTADEEPIHSFIFDGRNEGKLY